MCLKCVKGGVKKTTFCRQPKTFDPHLLQTSTKKKVLVLLKKIVDFFKQGVDHQTPRPPRSSLVDISAKSLGFYAFPK